MILKKINSIIEGAYEIKHTPFSDERGSFINLIKNNDSNFQKMWGDRKIEQINQSITKNKGTIRGMHLQKEPFAEAKLITCTKGSIFDVCIDLRKSSPTFGKWFQIILSKKLNNALFIPEGFAHGFQALEDNIEMIYIHSQKWSKFHELGINCKDKDLKIPWPIEKYNLSIKDENLPFLECYGN